ncbi:hypothetical protein CYMTET_12632 [Cymbomonas tetramitiformis]|uniref:Uncharacterized protein n=1 Tax=Cymbomonas tetramitiformis TaxID=36881 RepID=A0AAE0GJW9_9CHLO|nr:hypothetical protein CYMTET_12632 [Cymbomonas tetramitiformis]
MGRCLKFQRASFYKLRRDPGLAAAKSSIVEDLKRHGEDESANACAVPKPKAAKHHQSECGDEERAEWRKVKNAARGRDRAFGMGPKRDNSEGCDDCNRTPRHHQMVNRGRIRRRRGMGRDEGVGVKILTGEVGVSLNVDLGVWCTSTTRHHQTETRDELLMSE